jgi:hypothetical protein
MKRKLESYDEKVFTKRTRTSYSSNIKKYNEEKDRSPAEIERLTDKYFETSRFRLNILYKRSKEAEKHDKNEELYYKQLKHKKDIPKALNVHKPTRNFYLPKDYSIQVLTTSNEIDQWIDKYTSKARYIGCDTEWDFFKIVNLDKPYSSTTRSRYPDIITIATHTSCLIFPTRFQPPLNLLKLLSVDNIKKIWCGMGEDSELLQNWLSSLPPSEHVDKCIQSLNDPNIHVDLNKILPQDCQGCKKMTSRILGFIIKKDVKVTMSRWSRWELTHEQKEYAACDAIVNLKVYEKWTMN